MSIKLEMLRCFVAVAHSGNLADAADHLGRTPSAVSMMLKQLEERLGAPLFESDRKSRLTPLGQFALDEAVKGIEHYDHRVAAIVSYARSETGHVRVAAVPSVAEQILPLAVHRFLEERPGVSIDIRDMDSAGVLRELDRERIDLGLASGTGAPADIAREQLFSDDFGVVCRHDHALAGKRGFVRWPSLAAWPFIANALCARIGDPSFQQIFAGAKLMVRNTTSLLAMVRAGVGLTVLPRLAVAREEATLRFLPVSDRKARRQIDVLKPLHRSPSPAAQAFEKVVCRVTREVVPDP